MASMEAPPQAALEGDASTTIDASKNGINPADTLYDQCARKAQGTIFFQRDLSNMQVAETMAELTMLLQELCDRHLMKLMTLEGEPCWKLRSRSDADSLRRLTPDERLLYHFIDQAQGEGIWSKELRARTNVTQQALTKCLKTLESKGLVKSVMSVKFPSRRMYLLKHLQPSEDVVGGPWQTDGEYDQALIDTVKTVVSQYIENETCILVPSNWNDYPGKYKTAAIEEKKTQVRAVQDIEDMPLVQPFAFTTDPRAPTLLYKDDPQYPTADSVAKWLNDTGVLKERHVKARDMDELLQVMVFEGRLQQKTETDYRTDLIWARGTKVSNGFVDSPCGICPVFDRCGNHGEITARTCKYFADWLGTESEEVTS